MRNIRVAMGILAGAALLGAVACDTIPLSYGDPNSVIVVMSPQRWEEVSQDVYDAIEQTVMTVRDEKTFTATYQAPYGENWNDLRRFRQMLLVGTASDPWIQEALEDEEGASTEPGVQQVHDVWAAGENGQTLTVVILPETGGNEALARYLPEVHAMLDRQYRDYARQRMYFSGVDSALADTLRTEEGFSLLLPVVYRWMSRDSTFIFRNDNPDPSELIRQVGVTWKSPAPASLDVEALLEWRAELAEQYTEPQDFVSEGMSVDTSPFLGHEAIRIQSQWRNPPDRGWPAGGPLITLAVTCDSQDRTYLIDAWLYAPGREKYEYMIQLETILETFECG